MESTDYLRVLRRRWKIIIAAAFVTTLAVFMLAQTQALGVVSGSYTATATLVQPPDAANAGSVMPVKVTALLVTTGPVPAAVAKRINFTGDPGALADSLQVQPDTETGAVTVAATATDPDEAALVANTFAEETVAEVNQRAAGTEARIEILQAAVPQPTDTGLIRGPTTQSGRLLLGLIVGLILGSALALLLERFDTSVRDRADVERAYRVPVLAEIPRLPRSARAEQGVVVTSQPASMAAEAFRSLRSSVLLIPSRVLQPADRDTGRVDSSGENKRPQLILVTSARSGEGKTTVAVNLAAAVAEGGQRVLVLDCDFRRPDAHRFLDVPDGPGLSDLIHAGEDAQQLLALSRPTALDGIRLVTAGTMVDQPPALPTRIAGLLAEARGLADIVIVDSPPMLLGNDAMDLMPYVDTVLVACRSGRLRREQAGRASDLLTRMRVPVVGAALIGGRSSAPSFSQLLPHRTPVNGSSERGRRGVEASASERKP
jgi:Mrp family chromosome partitioning ATPase/capsular polysaccharide biosynthesis protein